MGLCLLRKNEVASLVDLLQMMPSIMETGMVMQQMMNQDALLRNLENLAIKRLLKEKENKMVKGVTKDLIVVLIVNAPMIGIIT